VIVQEREREFKRESVCVSEEEFEKDHEHTMELTD
jgi:hypothetical protein